MIFATQALTHTMINVAIGCIAFAVAAYSLAFGMLVLAWAFTLAKLVLAWAFTLAKSTPDKHGEKKS